MKKILVVGSTNMDLVMKVDRLPNAGETLLGSSFMTAHGGKGANQAVATARLGGEVWFVSCIGNDSFGHLQREGLSSEGIHLEYLKVTDSLPTGTAMILVSATGQNTIVVTPGANSLLQPEDIMCLDRVFRSVEAVICQLEIPLETVEAVLEMARKHSKMSILDAGPARRVPPEILAKASLVTPNETETEALTGIHVASLESARSAAVQLHNRGVAHVVIKLGEKGSLYLGDREIVTPGFHVPVVDTTGAGDAFTAALAVFWNRDDLEETLKFANAAGALATTVAGAQPSMPRRVSVETFLSK